MRTDVEDDVSAIHLYPKIRCLVVAPEEQIVLDDVHDLPTAVALLCGFVYALKN